MIDKLIDICYREFCDIVGDSPCSCDCCPYGEFGSENDKCYEEYKKDKLKALEAFQVAKENDNAEWYER